MISHKPHPIQEIKFETSKIGQKLSLIIKETSVALLIDYKWKPQ